MRCDHRRERAEDGSRSAPPHRRAGALLQRGGGDRGDRGGFPRRAAGRDDLRLRQQFDRPHDRNCARGRRGWCASETRQGKGHVVRRMFADVDADIYVLVDGDATYDAPSAPAMIEQLIEEQLDMVVGGARRSARTPPTGRASRRQPDAHRVSCAHIFGAIVQRHAVGLPGLLAPLREILSGALRRLRDRDRAHRPCARTRAAGRRGGHAVLRAARRLGVEAQHLARRLSHPVEHLQTLSRRTAAAHSSARSPSRSPRSRSASRSRSSSPSCRKASCRACRPRCWRPA